MNIPAKINPDFCVQWRDTSHEVVSQIYCEQRGPADLAFLNEKMRESIVILQTGSTCVAVTELTFNEPTTITLTPDRAGFCLTVSASPATSTQYGYEGELNQSCKPGHMLFFVPGRKIVGHGSTPGQMRKRR